MQIFDNKVITYVTLYTDHRDSYPVCISAKQHDQGTRYIQATIQSKSGTVNMYGSYVQMNATKPDGTKLYVIGTVNNQGIVTVGVSGELLDTPGKIPCDISFFDSEDMKNKILTTMTFYIVVEQSHYDPEASEGEVIIDGEPNIVERMVQQEINSAMSEHDADEGAHSDIRIWVGSVGGDVTSLNDTVRNNVIPRIEVLEQNAASDGSIYLHSIDLSFTDSTNYTQMYLNIYTRDNTPISTADALYNVATNVYINASGFVNMNDWDGSFIGSYPIALCRPEWSVYDDGYVDKYIKAQAVSPDGGFTVETRCFDFDSLYMVDNVIEV